MGGGTSETKAEIFAKYLEQGKVMTTRCNKCGKTTFPPRLDCQDRMSDDVEWIEIKEKGKLDTFTVVMYGSAGFEKETPYLIGVVKFPVGIRMLGQIDRKIPTQEIKVGVEMKVVPARLPDERYSYEFTGP